MIDCYAKFISLNMYAIVSVSYDPHFLSTVS